MNTSTRAQRYFAWCVLSGGILLLLHLSARFSQADFGEHPYTTIVLWLAMISVAGMSPVPLPRGAGTVHLTTALDFAALLIFGPLFACWVAVVARLFSNMAEKWNPFSSGLLRLGQAILSIGAAGLTYLALGGQFGVDLMVVAEQGTPLAAAGGAYALVGLTVSTLWESLAAVRPSLRNWRNRCLRTAALDAAIIPPGVLMALTQVRIGPVGVAIFLIPLLLARYVFKLWVEAKHAHVETVRTLMSAVDASDPSTWGHSYRISKMVVRVGRQLGLPDAELEEIEYAALLHDIGRTAIKRDIMLKPGRLSESEQSILRTHPRVGYELLRDLRFFPGAADVVHSHHERPDGKGYPRGLAGRDIPIGSRIIMAVAAFDAMTSDRPYRRGLTPDAALEELLNHTGTQFFPDVIEALIHLYSNDLLFQEFEERVMAHYAGGQGNSRALEAYFQRLNAKGGVMDKRGMEPGSAGAGPKSVPAAGGKPAGAHAKPAGVSGAHDAFGAAMDALPPAPFPTEAHAEVKLDGEDGGNLVVAGLSDPGCVRTNNEDSFGVFEAPGSQKSCLLAVADGMGGAAAGEVASRLALDTLRKCYLAEAERRGAADALAQGVERANEMVYRQANSRKDYDGMGTTCTAVVFAGNELHLAHVGDSRAYLVRSSSIESLTADHTLAAELAAMGRGGASVPENASHVLTRCLGTDAKVEVDRAERPIKLRAGDAIVLCSDGLTNLVADEEILETVRDAAPEAACRRLVELARERGGSDNITVVVGQVEA